MLKKAQIWLGFTGLLVIALSVILALKCVEQRTPAFWYTLGGFVLAVSLLIVAVESFGERRQYRGYLYRTGNLVICVFYLIFTFGILMIHNIGLPFVIIMLLELIPAVFMVVLHIFLSRAAKAANIYAIRTQELLASRQDFRLKTMNVRTELSGLLLKDAELKRAVEALEEGAINAPASLTDNMEIDTRIFNTLTEIEILAALPETTKSQLIGLLRNAHKYFEQRRELIKYAQRRGVKK